MPFQSEAQRRWMHANKPEVAKEWEAKTPEIRLPERVTKPTGVNRNAYKRKSIMRYTKRR